MRGSEIDSDDPGRETVACAHFEERARSSIANS